MFHFVNLDEKPLARVLAPFGVSSSWLCTWTFIWPNQPYLPCSHTFTFRQ